MSNFLMFRYFYIYILLCYLYIFYLYIYILFLIIKRCENLMIKKIVNLTKGNHFIKYIFIHIFISQSYGNKFKKLNIPLLCSLIPDHSWTKGCTNTPRIPSKNYRFQRRKQNVYKYRLRLESMQFQFAGTDNSHCALSTAINLINKSLSP